MSTAPSGAKKENKQRNDRTPENKILTRCLKCPNRAAVVHQAVSFSTATGKICQRCNGQPRRQLCFLESDSETLHVNAKIRASAEVLSIESHQLFLLSRHCRMHVQIPKFSASSAARFILSNVGLASKQQERHGTGLSAPSDISSILKRGESPLTSL